MARRITTEQIEQINELYAENKNKALTARLLGISTASVSKYIVPNYICKADRVVEVFSGRPA